MAHVSSKSTPAFLTRLKNALVADLKGSGIRARVQFVRIPTTRLFRIRVLAPQFKELRHSERQSLVWRIAEKALSPAEQLRISMILTLTAEELAGQ